MKQYEDLSQVPESTASFLLVPKTNDNQTYLARTDRNIGWITPEEQEILRQTTVGVGGCGGMGGLLSATLLRAGIGHLKIADLEVFDASNINRQFAARKGSVGLSKAVETARMLREIADDTSIHVYTRGINEESVAEFNNGCAVICDEIEFWAIGARMLLHEHIPPATTILNANSVGMGTRLFRFTAQSAYGMRDLLRLTLDEAIELERAIRAGNAAREVILKVQGAVLRGLVPDVPEYVLNPGSFSNKMSVNKRLLTEGKAPILATNPPMAAGFLANHVILEILRQKSPIERDVVYPPDMPGYLSFDAARMSTRTVVGSWW